MKPILKPRIVWSGLALLGLLLAAGGAPPAGGMTAAAGPTTFQKTYGGSGADYAYAVAGPLADGGFLLVGRTQSFGAGQSDIYVVRIDSLGNVLWSKTYGGSGYDVAHAVAGPLADGGFLLVGGTASFGAGGSFYGYDMYAVRINGSGDIVWSKTYGGSDDDVANAVVALPDGGFLLVGGTASFGAGDEDMYAVRINGSGDILWSKTYGGRWPDSANAVVALPDGGFLLVGRASSFGAGGQDMYAVRINGSGDILWSKTYGGSSWDEAYAVAGPLADGGFLLVGRTDSFGVRYYDDLYAVRIDSSGDLVWSKTYGGSGVDQAHAVAGPLADGGFLLVGWIFQSFGAVSYDMYAVRIDSSGSVLWSKTYDLGGTNRDEAYAVAGPLADGGFLLVGYTTGDIYAVRIDGSGASGCNETSPTTQTTTPTTQISGPSTQVRNPIPTVTSPATQTSAPGTQTNTLCLLAPTYRLYLPLVLRNW